MSFPLNRSIPYGQKVIINCQVLFNINETCPNIYEKRFELKEKLFNFILENRHKLNFDPETLANILKFILNIMKLKEKQERIFEQKIVKKFSKDMSEHKTAIEISFFNKLFEAFFGTSYKDTVSRAKLAEQETQKRKQAEQKRKQGEQKRKQAEQKRKQEEQKRIDLYTNLHFEKGMSIKDIADASDEAESYIRRIIEKAGKK